MAKVTSSFFELKGKLGGLVFVNNKTYGAYARMPRGTYKQAPLNAVLQANANKAKQVTATAGCVYRALKTGSSSRCFPLQRDLWQVMLKRMYSLSSTDTTALLQSLTGLELNEAYPLGRMVPSLPALSVRQEQEQVRVRVQPPCEPLFSHPLQADAYRYTLGIIWLDEEKGQFAVEEQATSWTDVTAPPASFSLSFALPAFMKRYLLLLSLEGGRNGQAMEAMKAKGRRIVATGTVAGG